MKYKIIIQVEGDESSEELEFNSSMVANTIQKALRGKIPDLEISNEFIDAYYRKLIVPDYVIDNNIVIEKLFRIQDQSEFYQAAYRDRDFK